MSSTGINRYTGQPLSGFAHVQQSLEVIFETMFGSRVMRRILGSDVPGLLGKNLTPQTLLYFMTAYATAINRPAAAGGEPRFLVRRFDFPPAQNTPERWRQGKIGFVLEGDYRPNALTGDFTVASIEKVTISR